METIDPIALLRDLRDLRDQLQHDVNYARREKNNVMAHNLDNRIDTLNAIIGNLADFTSVGNPQYDGSLRSGDFGPDSGRYMVYRQQNGAMEQFIASKGVYYWDSREAARAAVGQHDGHVAVVGSERF